MNLGKKQRAGRLPTPGVASKYYLAFTLLQREHDIILLCLSRLESTVRLLVKHATHMSEFDEHRLRANAKQTIEFFTKTVRVHYERESILFSGFERCAIPDVPACYPDVDHQHKDLSASAERLLGMLEGAKEPQSIEAECSAFIRGFRNHIAFEERVMLPLVAQRLDNVQARRIWQQMLNV